MPVVYILIEVKLPSVFIVRLRFSSDIRSAMQRMRERSIKFNKVFVTNIAIMRLMAFVMMVYRILVQFVSCHSELEQRCKLTCKQLELLQLNVLSVLSTSDFYCL